MPLVAPPVHGLALVALPELGDKHVPDLCLSTSESPQDLKSPAAVASRRHLHNGRGPRTPRSTGATQWYLWLRNSKRSPFSNGC